MSPTEREQPSRDALDSPQRLLDADSFGHEAPQGTETGTPLSPSDYLHDDDES